MKENDQEENTSNRAHNLVKIIPREKPSVTCPECGHEFVPGQEMHPMERMRKQSKAMGKMMSNKTEESSGEEPGDGYV